MPWVSSSPLPFLKQELGLGVFLPMQMVTSDLNAQGHISPRQKDFKSQILLESEASWCPMTYAVLLLWPRRSREEAAHSQKQGKSPTDFVELWISLDVHYWQASPVFQQVFSVLFILIYLPSGSWKPYIYLYFNSTSSLRVGAKRCTQTCLGRN